jgi:hypothetical protein
LKNKVRPAIFELERSESNRMDAPIHNYRIRGAPTLADFGRTLAAFVARPSTVSAFRKHFLCRHGAFCVNWSLTRRSQEKGCKNVSV